MEKQRDQQTSKGKSKNRMTQMRSSYIGSVRHEGVKQADWICENCDLTCKRADTQQEGNTIDSLKHIDTDSKLQDFFNS